MKTSKKTCQTCKGKKTIPGTCQCSSEWRGNQIPDGGWDDCRCTPELPCPACRGTGLAN